MRVIVICTVLLIASVVALVSGEPAADEEALLNLLPQETPEALATKYLEAYSQGDWTAVAHLSHFDDLVRMKALWMEGWKNDQNTIRRLFGLSEDESLKALDAVALFARMLERFEADDDETLASLVGNQGTRVLGTVEDGQDVHVVYRTNLHLMDVPVPAVDVVTCRAYEKGWLAKIPMDMEAILFAVIKHIDE